MKCVLKILMLANAIHCVKPNGFEKDRAHLRRGRSAEDTELLQAAGTTNTITMTETRSPVGIINGRKPVSTIKRGSSKSQRRALKALMYFALFFGLFIAVSGSRYTEEEISGVFGSSVVDKQWYSGNTNIENKSENIIVLNNDVKNFEDVQGGILTEEDKKKIEKLTELYDTLLKTNPDITPDDLLFRIFSQKTDTVFSKDDGLSVYVDHRHPQGSLIFKKVQGDITITYQLMRAEGLNEEEIKKIVKIPYGDIPLHEHAFVRTIDGDSSPIFWGLHERTIDKFYRATRGSRVEMNARFIKMFEQMRDQILEFWNAGYRLKEFKKWDDFFIYQSADATNPAEEFKIVLSPECLEKIPENASGDEKKKMLENSIEQLMIFYGNMSVIDDNGKISMFNPNIFISSATAKMTRLAGMSHYGNKIKTDLYCATNPEENSVLDTIVCVKNSISESFPKTIISYFTNSPKHSTQTFAKYLEGNSEMLVANPKEGKPIFAGFFNTIDAISFNSNGKIPRYA